MYALSYFLSGLCVPPEAHHSYRDLAALQHSDKEEANVKIFLHFLPPETLPLALLSLGS